MQAGRRTHQGARDLEHHAAEFAIIDSDLSLMYLIPLKCTPTPLVLYTHRPVHICSEQYTETDSPHTGAVHTQTSTYSRDGLLDQAYVVVSITLRLPHHALVLVPIQTSAHSRDGLLEQTCPRKLHLDKCSSEYTHTGAVHTQTSAHQ